MRVEGEMAEYGWETAKAQADHAYTWPAIEQLLPPGELRILDLGCGPGVITSRLAALGHSVIGIDVAEDGIRLARASYQNIRFEIGSVYDDLRPLAGEVDVVVSSEVIEHLYSPARYLQNIYDVLVPGGHLILTTPYHGYLKNLMLSVFDKWDDHHTVAWEGGHIKSFSPNSLKSMLWEAGFVEFAFNNAGRFQWMWKSMVCRARRRNIGPSNVR